MTNGSPGCTRRTGGFVALKLVQSWFLVTRCMAVAPLLVEWSRMSMLQDSVACFHVCEEVMAGSTTNLAHKDCMSKELSCSYGPLLPLARVQTLVIWLLTLSMLM